jgi:hypothetical protein
MGIISKVFKSDNLINDLLALSKKACILSKERRVDGETSLH